MEIDSFHSVHKGLPDEPRSSHCPIGRFDAENEPFNTPAMACQGRIAGDGAVICYILAI
jgi:hypothetical protein